MRKSSKLYTCIVVAAGLGLLSARMAIADDTEPKTRQVDCSKHNDTIQKIVDKVKHGRPTVILVSGTCAEDVSIHKDDVTLKGNPGATVKGTVSITGARRVAVESLRITGSGPGIVATGNASISVRDSQLDHNALAGILVRDGAHADITGNAITDNGQSQPPSAGRGVLVNDGASASVKSNTISDNYSDGIGVFNDAYARLEDNTIERNGRAAVFDAGLQISRARVVANGNRYRDNPYAAIAAYNSSTYRTGTFLTAAGDADNLFAFEQIVQGTGQTAVEMGRLSLVDLRQVNVTGQIFVGNHSQLQIRGDRAGPNKTCSSVNGNISASSTFSVVRLRTTQVNGIIFIGPDARLIGGSICPPF